MIELFTSMGIYSDDDTGAGTVGGFFTMKGIDVYGITNRHVIANSTNCQVGDPVFKAGTTDKIGELHYWVALDETKINYLDVAFFKLDEGVQYKWRCPDGCQVPKVFADVQLKQEVYIVTNEGNKKTGIVNNPHIGFNMPFVIAGRNCKFSGLIEIKARDGGAFSQPGLSGTIVCDASHNAVGILMGTSRDQNLSYAVPFKNATHGIDQVYLLHIAPGDQND